jgi:hypothetical protein
MKKLMIAVVLFALFLPMRAHAENLSVSAGVAYDIPYVAATFVSPSANFQTNSNTIRLTGTCQVVQPFSVVTIWRSSGQIGSVICSGGSFSIDIGLILGVNQLTARTSNASDVFGPDSIVLVARYEPAAKTVDPTPNPFQNISLNNSGLTVTSSKPYVQTSSDSLELNATLSIDGGDSPYKVHIRWGDGSTKESSQTGKSILLNHTYPGPGSYQIEVTVSDKFSNSALHVLTVYVLGESTVNKVAASATVIKSVAKTSKWLPTAISVASAFGAGILIGNAHLISRLFTKKPLVTSNKSVLKKGKK